MTGKLFTKLIQNVRFYSDSSKEKDKLKLVLVGASGGIGQALALLLKQQPLITDLALYDIKHTAGVAADLSHIPTKAKVTGTTEEGKLESVLKDAQIVLIPAGMPRKPGMTRDDLFETNACVVADIIKQVAISAPKAMIALITNPINSTIPVAAEILRNAGVYDPKRLFGVTTLDVLRAKTFIADAQCINPVDVKLPVIGGHSAETIIPLFSQCKPEIKLEEKVLKDITKRIQNAGTEVVEAKKGKGSATLSMAYAAATFIDSLCRGMKGEKDVIECAMVNSDVSDVKFFASPVVLGPEGIQKNLGTGKLNPFENQLYCDAIRHLSKDIEKGCDFAKRYQEGNKK